MENPTDYVIRFILDTNWQNIPTDVQHQSKRCLLDTLGALLAGTETPVGGLMAGIATAQFNGNDATILVSGSRVSASGAALANGFAGNALDIDDGYRLIKGHPGSCILPVVLSASEVADNCPGSQFLTAMIIGYEIGIRAGLIRHAVYPTYHTSGSWGSISGAAAAGKLMGLEGNALLNALGTAEYHAPIAPMMKGIETPSMGKDSIGWGAMVAMMSVLMAEKGFTGIKPIFDDTPQREWVESLGHHYEMLNLYFKPYAACRWAQPAIAGALKVSKDNEIIPEDIVRIQVRTFKEAKSLSDIHPQNTEEAQYNLAFPLAAALIDGEVGPEQILPPRIFSSQILKLADKVDTEVSELFDQLFPEKTCAEVIVHTESGASFSSDTMEAPWEPPDNLPSDSEIEEKFHGLVDPILGVQQTHQLCSLIWNLDNCYNIQELIGLCLKR
jgi:2-methylcitrate dehydratase PrpD